MTIDEQLKNRIGRITSWTDLNQLEANIKSKGALSPEIEEALSERSTALGVDYILKEIGLSSDSFDELDLKIIAAVGEYAAIKRRQGKYPRGALRQIANRGLMDAAESAVCQKRPTQGYQALADANLEDLSYERIVVDHEDEFSPRAVWYARRTLGLGNDNEKPPAPTHSDVSVRTKELLKWLKDRANANDGSLGSFTNADAATAIGLGSLRTFGRVHGNIQSRIDFACYLSDLPPLGCAALRPFENAWGQDQRSWAFPVDDLQKAAQSYIWTDDDFARIQANAEGLPGTAHIPWRKALNGDEQKVRVWAFRWAKAETSTSAIDQRHLYRMPADVLSLASPEFIWDAVQRTLRDGPSEKFGASTDFDLIVGDQRLPPKAVFGLALSLALNGQEVLPKHFQGGEGSVCFRLLREAGFTILPKGETAPPASGDDSSDPEWREGDFKLVPHRRRERAPGLALAKKTQYRRLHGKLTCERCGFDPVQSYGSIAGEACIEVHHAKVMVSEMLPGHITSLDDLECLCANCHRYEHRKIAMA